MQGFWVVGTLLLPQLDLHQCPAPDHSHIATSLPSSKGFANRTGATITCCTATPNARPIGVFAHQTTHTRFGRRTCWGGREACGVLDKQRMIRDLFNAKSRICGWFLCVFFGATNQGPWASIHLTSGYHPHSWHSIQHPSSTRYALRAHSTTHRGELQEPIAQLDIFHCKYSCIDPSRQLTISPPETIAAPLEMFPTDMWQKSFRTLVSDVWSLVCYLNRKRPGTDEGSVMICTCAAFPHTLDLSLGLDQ